MVSTARRLVALCSTAGIVALTGCFPGDRPIAQRMACVGDTCACMAGFDNCDGQPYDGCETDLSFDPRHCGSCGVRCDNGQCVDGECVASAGYVNCNQGWHDGFEAHLQSDPANCGACDHDCMGGSCANGRCEPFLPVEPGFRAWSLTAHGTHLYFCEWWTEAIMRIPQTGGEVEILALDQGCSGDVAVAGESAYWLSDVGVTNTVDLVVQGAVDEERVTIIGSASAAWSVRAAGDTVAWAAEEDLTLDDLIVVRNGTAAPAEIYRTLDTVGALALSGDDLYFIEHDDSEDPMWLMKIPVVGGLATPETEVARAGVNQLRATAEHVYWIEWIGETPDDDEYKVMQLPRSGGGPVELYRGHNRQSSSVPMQADGAGVYWAEENGIQLLYLPPGGGEPDVLAEYQEIESLATSPAALFWYDSPAKIIGLAKKEAP